MFLTLEDVLSYASIRSALVVAFISLAYVVALRPLLHPLRSFPGPRLARATELYAAYYELWRDGDLVTHLKELHSIYGPVVRIRPNELHFNTPQAYFAIYPPHSGFIKDHNFSASIGVSESTAGFIDVKKHKQRKDMINPLFSRRGILKFERNIQDNIDHFMQRLREYGDKPVHFKCGFRALTMDIIAMYCYGYTFGGIDAPEFDHPIPSSLDKAVTLMAASRYIPLLRAVQWLPPKLLARLQPGMASFSSFRGSIRESVETYLANPDSFRKAEQETIYHHLLPESVDPSQWPSKVSLVDEAVVLLRGGTDTTSGALNVGFFHLLLDENKDVRKKLEDELHSAWPEKDSPFSFEQAEKLPYLTGVVKESLRLSIGVPVPLSRLAVIPAVIDGVYVPAGTIVSVSAKFLLLNPDTFPEPDKFMPERWMQPNSSELDKNLVIFSRGPRACLGMNLAWCEMYLVISHLVRKFDFKLYNTSLEDMETRDFVVPRWSGKGLHAIVKERSE